ncbi:MAG: ABC transporter substrate-binding protein [Anaerolineae bacterium]|nr:ABC transporter substrate-binding protein [Anaerolineae bacterium]
MFDRDNSRTRNHKKWIILIVAIVMSILLSGCVEEPKVYRVGVLAGLNYLADITEGFKDEMTRLGYVEGENITYDVQSTDFDMDTYQSIVQGFIDDDVDLILAFPTEAAVVAKETTEGTDIPVVFSFAFIEEIDLIDSVLEPGGNITGVRYPGPDVAIKRLEIMLELAPDAERIWVPFQRGYPSIESQLNAMRPIAEEAGITLLDAPVDDAAEIEAELEELAESSDDGVGIDAILLLADPISVTPDAIVAMGKFAEEHEIPLGGALIEADGYGTIFGVNVDIIDAGKKTAPLADKVLQGTPAGTIPVVSGETFLQINYTRAQDVGIEVSDSLLNQANEVIR